MTDLLPTHTFYIWTQTESATVSGAVKTPSYALDVGTPNIEGSLQSVKPMERMVNGLNLSSAGMKAYLPGTVETLPDDAIVVTHPLTGSGHRAWRVEGAPEENTDPTTGERHHWKVYLDEMMKPPASVKTYHGL